MESLLKKDTEIDPYDVITSIIARNVSKEAKLSIPKELLSYRNVVGQT